MIEQFADFWRSQTSRLMLIYLGIIMAMSITFSGIIYAASIDQLEGQLLSDQYVDADGRFVPTPRVQLYISQMVQEGKHELVLRLYVLNLVMLIFGAAFSFMLARWTLEPIERNVEAQTRFVTDASHELRTPLTAIQTTNEVALRRKKLRLTEARAVIESNLDDVRRLQRMTTMLLELVADARDIVAAPTSVHDIVSRAMTDVAAIAIDRRVEIDDRSEDRLVMAESDSAAQALTILLDNAIKYSDESGVVVIGTSLKRRSQVAINVTDNGPGIATEDQKRIFSRFYRSDTARSRSSTGGYGLGLEIAQKIARAHNGSIELRSTLGGGSTFSLLLPVAKKPAPNR